MDIFTAESLTTLLQVIAIDLLLAGDNAVVIGLAAAGLNAAQRRKAIIVGILVATMLRIVFASVAVYLLAVVGLLLAGGLLLLWVCWKMWRELRSHSGDGGDPGAKVAPNKTFFQAVTQIVIADVSMSLDNVLAVAGAAREHPAVLVIGLALSIGLMGVAANLIARLLNNHRWIAFIGLAIILYVSLDMIYRGTLEVMPRISTAAAWQSRLIS